jgi:zinc transport system substrate-binding protein
MLLIWPFSNSSLQQDEDTNKTTVIVSNFALYDIVNSLAKDKVKLSMVLPFGTDIHHFEPSAKTIITIGKSDLFLYNGASLEPWLTIIPQDIIEGIHSLGMSNYVHLEHQKDTHNHNTHSNQNKHDHEEHTTTAVDPHYWLDIDNMITQTKIIEKELIKLLPHNDAHIKSHAQEYRSQLEKLRNSYKNKLLTCKHNTIIMNHNAFGYIANDYNFEIASISNLSPDAQPSAKVLIELSNIIKEKNIKTIFFESFVSNKLIQTIAKETNATVKSVHTLANITPSQVKNNENYISLMYENLDLLTNALECQNNNEI